MESSSIMQIYNPNTNLNNHLLKFIPSYHIRDVELNPLFKVDICIIRQIVSNFFSHHSAEILLRRV